MFQLNVFNLEGGGKGGRWMITNYWWIAVVIFGFGSPQSLKKDTVDWEVASMASMVPGTSRSEAPEASRSPSFSESSSEYGRHADQVSHHHKNLSLLSSLSIGLPYRRRRVAPLLHVLSDWIFYWKWPRVCVCVSSRVRLVNQFSYYCDRVLIDWIGDEWKWINDELAVMNE